MQQRIITAGPRLRDTKPLQILNQRTRFIVPQSPEGPAVQMNIGINQFHGSTLFECQRPLCLLPEVIAKDPAAGSSGDVRLVNLCQLRRETSPGSIAPPDHPTIPEFPYRHIHEPGHRFRTRYFSRHVSCRPQCPDPPLPCSTGMHRSEFHVWMSSCQFRQILRSRFPLVIRNGLVPDVLVNRAMTSRHPCHNRVQPRIIAAAGNPQLDPDYLRMTHTSINLRQALFHKERIHIEDTQSIIRMSIQRRDQFVVLLSKFTRLRT